MTDEYVLPDDIARCANGEKCEAASECLRHLHKFKSRNIGWNRVVFGYFFPHKGKACDGYMSKLWRYPGAKDADVQ